MRRLSHSSWPVRSWRWFLSQRPAPSAASPFRRVASSSTTRWRRCRRARSPTSPSSLNGQSWRVRAPCGSSPASRARGALRLTGTQHQYVDVPTSSVLDVNRYTLSAWVRYTGCQNDQTLGRWEVLEKAGAYWMNVRTNGLVRVGGFHGGCANANWQFFDSSRAIPVNRWKHVATTYDGTWLRVYIVGRGAGAKRVSGRTCVSGEPLAVGRRTTRRRGCWRRSGTDGWTKSASTTAPSPRRRSASRRRGPSLKSS